MAPAPGRRRDRFREAESIEVTPLLFEPHG